MMRDMTVEKDLRRDLARHGLSQSDLARLIGRNLNTVNKWANYPETIPTEIFLLLRLAPIGSLRVGQVERGRPRKKPRTAKIEIRL